LIGWGLVLVRQGIRVSNDPAALDRLVPVEAPGRIVWREAWHGRRNGPVPNRELNLGCRCLAEALGPKDAAMLILAFGLLPWGPAGKADSLAIVRRYARAIRMAAARPRR